MNRRSMLKVLPLVALAGISIKVGEVEGKAFEMKPNKKYLFIAPGISTEAAIGCRSLLLERGIDATVCSSDDLKIYEL